MSPPAAGTLVVDGIWAHASVAASIVNSAPLSRRIMCSSLVHVFSGPLILRRVFTVSTFFIDFIQICVLALRTQEYTQKLQLRSNEGRKAMNAQRIIRLVVFSCLQLLPVILLAQADS